MREHDLAGRVIDRPTGNIAVLAVPSNLGSRLVTPTKAAMFPPTELFAMVIKAGSKSYVSALFLHP